MIELLQNNICVALLENPIWVYKLDNGDFGLCDYERAEAVCANGKIYAIREPIEGLEYATLNKIDGGAMLNETTTLAQSTEDALCELDMQYSDRLLEIEDALTDLDMGGDDNGESVG